MSPPRGRVRTLRRDLDACTGDGATYSFMVGIGETYLAAFVVALGLSGVTSGLIAAAPPVAGGFLQLLSRRGVRLLGSPRRWVILCALLQGTALVPLAIGGVVGAMPTWAVFLCASLYWTGALSAAGPWTTWVGELFPARIRARYFSTRNRFCHLLTLAGLLLGGGLISVGTRSGHGLVAFAACFGLAALARYSSTFFLARQSDLPPHHVEHRHVTLGTVLGGRTPAARIILALVAMQCAVQIGQPYFNPFMLKALGYDPVTYTVAVAAAFVAKSLALPIAGRMVDRRGARAVLVGAAIGVGMLAMVWLVSGSPLWIVPSQLVAGAVWGAYELTAFLMLVETSPARERTSYVGWYHLLNSSAMVTGSLLGAFLLQGDETWQGYATIFAASTFARLLAVVPFMSIHADVRRSREMVGETVAVRASAGSINMPQDLEQSEGGDSVGCRPEPGP